VLLGTPTNWGFQQLTALAGAPASYLRTLPAELAATCVNHGLKTRASAHKTQTLTHYAGEPRAEVRAFTSPKYGRVWDVEVIDQLIERFGDGATGDWRVPGKFGHLATVTKNDTTLYWGDRSMFVFLCNERNRIVVDNRRNGQSGTMARGFFVWNSEVGRETVGFSQFLFDFVCSNRIIWGVQDVRTVKIRHSKTGPERFLDEVVPELLVYSNRSPGIEEATIRAAQAHSLGAEEVEALTKRIFGPRMVDKLTVAFVHDEGRHIASLFDWVVAATAYARKIPYTDIRVSFEQKACKVLDLVKVDRPPMVQGASLAALPTSARGEQAAS